MDLQSTCTTLKVSLPNKAGKKSWQHGWEDPLSPLRLSFLAWHIRPGGTSIWVIFSDSCHSGWMSNQHLLAPALWSYFKRPNSRMNVIKLAPYTWTFEQKAIIFKRYMNASSTTEWPLVSDVSLVVQVLSLLSPLKSTLSTFFVPVLLANVIVPHRPNEGSSVLRVICCRFGGRFIMEEKTTEAALE